MEIEVSLTRTTTIRDRIKELRRVRARDLLPHPKNWRVHTDAQAAALRGLLGEIGYADALLARELPDGSLTLIDGHLRAETTPDSLVPVLVLDVNEEEADKLLLTLDPLAGMALADAARLQALLASVQTNSPAVGEMLAHIAEQEASRSFDAAAQLLDPEPQINRAAELQVKWGTALGQIWKIHRHRLACGDCRDLGLVLRLWPDLGPRFRTITTDPPYGVDYAAKNAYLNRTDRGNRIQIGIRNDNLTAEETAIMFKTALEVAKQFAEPGAACYATAPGGPLLAYFIMAFQASGFEFKHLLVWLKQQFVIGMADYHHRFEPILYGWLPDGAHYFVDDRSQDDVFEIDRPHKSDTHPTCKPIELMARMIANSSRRGEIVYDPFCGSASTLIAAHQLGRVGYGVEIDPGYVAVALERLSTLGLKPQLVKSDE